MHRLQAGIVAGQPSPARAETLDSQSHWSGSLSRTSSDVVDDTGDGNGLRALVSDVRQKGIPATSRAE